MKRITFIGIGWTVALLPYICWAQTCPNPRKIGNDLRITNNTGSRGYPSLVWTNTMNEYGLSWNDSRDANDEIYFCRISEKGDKVLSDVRITNATGDSRWPQLVWNGSEYAVTWGDNRDGNWEIYFTRISAAGSKIASDLRVTYNSQLSGYPPLAWTQSEYGVGWDDFRHDSNGLCEQTMGDPDCNYEIYFTRLSALGAKIGGDVRITNNIWESGYPSLAWADAINEYGLSWHDKRDGNYEIYFARISAGGTKIGSDVRITNATNSSGEPSLVWADSVYGVSWGDYRDGNLEIYFTRISASGSKIGGDNRVTNFAGESEDPSLTWTGFEYGVSWRDRRDGNREIYFARISAGGEKIGIDLRITSDANWSTLPSLAWTGTEYGVSWTDNRDGYWEIYFARIGCDNDGDGLDNVWEETYGCMMASTVDNLADYDSDGLNNAQEYAANTNPCDPDTDHDLASDGAEVKTYFTNPLNPDTDGDWMLDGWEIFHLFCLDPLVADGATDFDGDGLPNVHEYYNDNGDGNVSDPCDDQKPRRGWPGGGYFGDADGNLLIGVPDLNKINIKLNDRLPDYSNVFPADPLIQDLDGNLIIGVPDKDLISLILNGKLTDYIAGTPTELSLVEPLTPPTVAVGDTVRIQVKLTKDGTVPRAGFGVVFTIVSGAGTLLGGEGISGSGRYDLTALDGVAQMVVRADGSGTPIVVHTELPYDSEVHTRNVIGPEIQINVN